MLIEEMAKEFNEKKELKEPDFTAYVKTGRHVERAPQRHDWWYVRSAAILYRIYKCGPVGTERLRTYYGGRKNRGVRPHKVFKAGGKIIRTCLQELEKNGYIKKEKTGRAITGKGEKFLVLTSKTVQAQFDSKLKREHEKRFAKIEIKIVKKPKPVEVKPEGKGKENGREKKPEVKGKEMKPDGKGKPAEAEKPVENKKSEVTQDKQDVKPAEKPVKEITEKPAEAEKPVEAERKPIKASEKPAETEAPAEKK